jgi:hypothetical protein
MVEIGEMIEDFYKVSEWSKAGKDFYSVFHISIQPFFDSLMSVTFNKIKIDFFKLNDYLHRVHGNYENEDKSIMDIVRENYGEDAVTILGRFI